MRFGLTISAGMIFPRLWAQPSGLIRIPGDSGSANPSPTLWRNVTRTAWTNRSSSHALARRLTGEREADVDRRKRDQRRGADDDSAGCRARLDRGRRHGYNGDLELPQSLFGSLNERYVGRVTSALAGGQTIEEDAYQVDFPMDGRTLRADATFVDGNEILMGTHLLRRHRLTIDFVAQTVKLVRVR